MENISIGIKRTAYHYRLRQARLKLGLTQEDMAQRCGINLTSYGLIELLRQFPTESIATAIADIVGENPEELFPKWTMPAFNNKNKLEDRVVQINRVALSAPEVRLLEAPNDVEEQIDGELLQKKIEVTLSTLTPRESEVIRRRFGLNGGKPETLEEVGYTFGVTRDRIRQIQEKAIRKMKHSTRRYNLASFV